MLRVWQKPLLNNKKIVQYDFATPGTHTQVLDAGIWDVDLVGGGGGGVGLYHAINPTFYAWADGGVGGTLRVRIKVPTQMTITINVAGATNSKTVVYGSADNGQATTVTMTGLSLTAGGGTGGAFLSGSNQVPGVIGTNSASGENLLQILANNENIVLSKGAMGSGKRAATATRSINTNWSEDPTKGQGGAVYPENPQTSSRLYSSGTGFVRIKSVE